MWIPATRAVFAALPPRVPEPLQNSLLMFRTDQQLFARSGFAFDFIKRMVQLVSRITAHLASCGRLLRAMIRRTIERSCTDGSGGGHASISSRKTAVEENKVGRASAVPDLRS